MQSKSKNWFYLFSSNYLGIVNDNFLKHSIIFTGVAWVLPDFISQSVLISIISAALVVPYLLFSPLGGRLAVNYSKQKVFRWCKIAEFPIMFFAMIAFYYQSVILSIAAVLLMGIQSCLYSPSKYGLIKDIGGVKGVSFGNGMFETMAFLGILSGTVFAAIIADCYSFRLTTALFIALTLLGYLATAHISVKEISIEKQENKSINPIKFLKESYLFAKQFQYINIGILGVSLFWLLGGLIQMNLVIHCTKTLQTGNTAAGICMATAAVGIALGCTMAGNLSRGKVNTNFIFFGLVGMIIFLLGIVIFNPPFLICAILIFLIAFLGGFFEVPCLALVQKEDTGRQIGDMLAYMNLIIFIFVLLGSLIFFVVTQFISDSSITVFWVITGICILTLFYFLYIFVIRNGIQR
jgi:acyl-[acyl-carrier-protein]-phospholipid O-acyltransferase/long-chain-fatty-acid--[acyl-carrier-protein] ligase